jgi:hypothetical protein
MPSVSYGRWTTIGRVELNEIEQAHAAIGGKKPGRRHATQQINRAYVVLLASQFQRYCRALHSECVDYLVPNLLPLNLQPSVRTLLTQDLQLKSKNAQPASIGADFNRFGVDFWTEVAVNDPRKVEQHLLQELNTSRNAIAHQDFDDERVFRLREVRRWRRACERLAKWFDEVMRRHLENLTGTSPW